MPNFIQEKIKQVKQFQKNIKQCKYTKKDIAIAVSAALVLTTAYGISSFNPGMIHYAKADNPDKKVSIAEFSKLAGPQQTIAMEDKNPLKRKIQRKTGTEKQAAASTLPMGDFGINNSLNSSFGRSLDGGLPIGGGASERLQSAREAYEHFSTLSGRIRSVLNSSFVLKNISEAPVSGRENRFLASYEYADAEGTVLEKMELMSIVRDSRLKDIKTAQQALDSLVEESQSIRVLESHDDYLIYEFAGNGGYQIGKISIDEKTINIFGYVNLTTSDLPNILKSEWISHYQSDL